MNQMNTPELTLSKALEFIKTNDEENAIIIINDFILNNKKKNWTSSIEQLLLISIELAVKKNRLKLLKDGLNYYRSLSQNNNIDSFSFILNKAKELVEDKFLKAQKSYQGIKVDIQDLDSEDSPELFLLYSFDDETETNEKEDFINSQKFIWETYKILLDFTKTNSKLLPLYSIILKAAFNFCKENKRKVEFKRLCDSVRGYLQTLIKTEKRQHFMNKVQISRPEVLKILIQIRINLLDTATELEQWQEAFKTAEDIIFLMDKYEKQTQDEAAAALKKPAVTAAKGEKVKKSTKIPPLMKLEFYSNIMKLLWISDYYLYHANAVILLKEIGSTVEKVLKTALEKGNPEKIKELKSKLEKHDFYHINNFIVLSALVTPYKNAYTNYVTKGDELFESEKEIEAQTCHRMMGILKLSEVPSRKNLINFIETNNTLSECDENIRNLYELLENESNPLKIAKKSECLINLLKSDEKYEKFANLISKNIIVKCVMKMSSIYDSISFSRLQNIFKWESIETLEEVLSEQTRIKVLDCIIDHSNYLVRFKNSDSMKRSFEERLNKCVFSVEKLCVDIMRSDLTKDQKKFNYIKSAIFAEVYSQNSNSLAIYDNLISQLNLTNLKLDEFYKKKEAFKYDQREKRFKEINEQKQKADEDAKMMREILKDEQKQKELDIQLKKYLIDRIKVYTGVIMQGSKKLKLEDLLKDLSKTTVEDLIKILENEEINFKTKKEKKFKEVTRNADYILREYRRRDFELQKNNLENEEKNYNEIREKEHKINYDAKIGFKSNLQRVKIHKEKFFSDILTLREKEYKERMGVFRENLEKVVYDEILKDVNNHFKPYILDLRTREEEQRKKMQYQPSSFTKTTNKEFVKGQNFVRFEDKPRNGDDFERGSKFEKIETTTTSNADFKRGEKITEPHVYKIAEILRGSAIKKEEPTEFKRGEKISETPVTKPADMFKGTLLRKEEPTEFKRGEKLPETTGSKPGEIIRGSAIKKEEPTEFKRGERVPESTVSKLPEFTRGEKLIDTSSTTSKAEISRGSALPKKETEKEVKKSENASEFARAGKKEEPIVKREFKAESTIKQTETDTVFSRGAKVTKEEPKPNKDQSFIRGKIATPTANKEKEPEKKAADDKWGRGSGK